MLGTETVRALRAQGVTAKICGCSANNMEDEFMEAGADSFLLKPFPCEKDELRLELLRVLNSHQLPNDDLSPKVSAQEQEIADV